MQREDVKKIIMMLSAVYTSEFNRKSEDDIKQMIDVWSVILKDDDADKMAQATLAYVSSNTNAFTPTPAMLREKAYELFTPKGLTEQEIVTKLKYAICNSGYYAQRMYDNLPEEIQILCSPSQLRSWSQIDEKEVDTVVMSLATRGLQKRMVEKKNNDMLPNSVKTQISEITKSLKLENKGDDEDEN
jgi:hypothetical protein